MLKHVWLGILFVLLSCGPGRMVSQADAGWGGHGGGWGGGYHGGWGGGHTDIHIGGGWGGNVATGIGTSIVGNVVGNWIYHQFEPAPAPVIVQQPVIVAPPGPVPEAVAQPWTPAWYDYCGQRYKTFDAHDGYYMGIDGQRHFCQ